jgi:hypothetical protein
LPSDSSAPIKLQAAALLSRTELIRKWIQEYGSDKIILVRMPTMKSGHISGWKNPMKT